MKRLFLLILVFLSISGIASAGKFDVAYQKAITEADQATANLVKMLDLTEFEEQFGVTLTEEERILIRVALLAYSNNAMQVHPYGAAGKSVASTETEEKYIGNKNSKKFHYPWCSSVSDIKEKNKVIFGSRDEAIEEGLVPCKKCNP